MGRRDGTLLAIVAGFVLLVVLANLYPAVLISALSVFLPAREGRVLVKPENQPIAGATVKARCQVIDPSQYFSLHGSVTRDAPDSLTTSDDRGRYSFDARALSACWVVFVSAEKPGYETTSEVVWRSLLNVGPRHAPGRNGSDVWMMPLEASHDRYLRILIVHAEPVSGETVAEQFDRMFYALSCSMRNAQSPQQRAFVRDNLCDRARAMVERLSPRERSTIGSTGETTSECSLGGGILVREPLATEAVETYCRTP